MTGGGRRALVVTVVHHPEDSRIRHREIGALLDAGWQVTYAAPFAAHGEPARTDRPGLTAVDLPRAAGRRRLRAARAARALLRDQGPRHDVVLVHDPELLLAATGLGLDHLVWDVHEDAAGALAVKEWMPRPLRRPVAAAWRLAERRAERRWPLLLAEHAYADRFDRPHPVVPNAVLVPESVPAAGGDRVVYIGNLTLARGVAEMVDAARRMHRATDGQLVVEIVGPARDEASGTRLRQAHEDGVLRWRGFLPAAEAMPLLDGALAGLSLLADLPNYRGSMPTKVVEYLAHGVPAITTGLPLARELVEAADAGLVVPFGDGQAAAEAVLTLWRDPQRAAAMGARGRALVRERYDWAVGGPAFVAALESVAAASSPRG